MKKKAEIKRLFKYLKPYIPRFFAAILFMILYAVMDVYVLTVLNNFINKIFLRNDTAEVLLKIALVFPVVYAVLGIADYGRSYLLNYIGQNVIRDMRKELHSKLMSLSHNFYVKNSSAKIMSRVTNDLGMVQNAIVRVPATVTKELLIFVGVGVYVFYLNWKFATALLLVLPLVALPLIALSRRMKKASLEGQSQTAEIYSSLSQMLNGFSVIKAFVNEKHEIQKFRKDNNKFYNIALNIIRIDARLAPMIEVIGACGAGVVLFFGGRDVINGVWSSGDFIVFFYAITKMYKPLKNFAEVNSQLQSGLAGAERVFEILDEKPSIKDKENAAILPSFKKSIIYKDVDFGYNADKLVLEKFNVEIKYGQTVAFVGHSGSGKTTIANLLMRFYDPHGGNIFIDGIDIKNAAAKSLREQIGIVSQDVMLFDDTIKYNISYGHFDASMQEISEAAKNANAHDFISALPEGYDTLVGERGIKLSGGEKQRISIARAILKNPPILLLDEATSALDSKSEQLVQQAIENLMESRTVILIAHRLATVKNADKIIVMDKGRAVESGTHEELMKIENGIYKKLNKMQKL
ncbi:MAG: ABC transporter ATP-binding protein/permease [Endomicrobium sp.]|jgi:subfamily B ATP-binding cassette protein MsbA|nr:ABC transporter ATP-binding protein/permease [Endomicrobium sp.]